MSRKEAPISSAKQWNDKPNRYLEPIGEERIGILFWNVVFPTKLHQWRIEFRPNARMNSNKAVEKPSTFEACNNEEVGFGFFRGFSPPWSSVNNCTVGSTSVTCIAHSLHSILRLPIMLSDNEVLF